MYKTTLAAVAALALSTGVALAQPTAPQAATGPTAAPQAPALAAGTTQGRLGHMLGHTGDGTSFQLAARAGNNDHGANPPLA
jgi:hypothetical protein